MASSTDTPSPTLVYEIDPTHTYIGFSVRHMMVTQVRGQFHGVSGRLELNRSNLNASTLTVTVDIATVDTHLGQRDDHLRSPDFFDATNYPTMTFVAREAGAQGDGLTVTGDLTIRGVTRSVTFDAEPITDETKDPWGMVKIGASATAKINRKDFGLAWNAALEAGGVVVGDEVKITADLEFQRKA